MAMMGSRRVYIVAALIALATPAFAQEQQQQQQTVLVVIAPRVMEFVLADLAFIFERNTKIKVISRLEPKNEKDQSRDDKKDESKTEDSSNTMPDAPADIIIAETARMNDAAGKQAIISASLFDLVRITPKDAAPVTYAAAAAKDAKPEVARYLTFLKSATAQVLFERYGFTYLLKAGP